MKTRLLPLLLALSIGVLSACGSDKPATPEQQPVALSVDPPKVSLTSKGEGEAAVIAYKDAGANQESTVEFTDGFDQGTGEAGTLPEEAPQNPHVDTLSATLNASTTGSEKRDVAIKMSKANHSNLAFASDVNSAEGFELGWTAQASGRSETVKLKAPEKSSDQGRAIAELYLMKLLAQPIIFPTDPVAPGATWTVENRVAGDSTMLRSTTYTLVSHKGSIVELDATISERPAVTALTLDGEGGQGELKVINSHSIGTGRFTIDLAKPIPTAGKFSLTTRVTYGQDNSTKRVFQDFNSGITFK
ncbi:hypothetical protein [Corynebacterium sp. H130]|uniref:hypothetical protein n=1 Tax=Corynebacterium sp. H130 TaxID=3133444 RepID=UPI0030976BC9